MYTTERVHNDMVSKETMTVILRLYLTLLYGITIILKKKMIIFVTKHITYLVSGLKMSCRYINTIVSGSYFYISTLVVTFNTA